MIGWSLGAGLLFASTLLAAGGVLPRAFTGDPGVLDRAREIWPLFALLLLPGAGDTRYLKWSMVAAAAVYVPVAVLALVLGWEIVGPWCGLLGLMLVRLLTLLARFRTERWAVVGAAA